MISGAFSLLFSGIESWLPSKDENNPYFCGRKRSDLYSLTGFLLIVTIALVLSFKNSSNLASAYGIVTTTMLMTTILLFITMVKLWKWNIFVAVVVDLFFLIIVFSFWGANMLKIFQGGWVPLAIGAFIYL